MIPFSLTYLEKVIQYNNQPIQIGQFSAIKNILKQDDLTPEIAEKLLQMQRYQEKQIKPDAALEAELRKCSEEGSPSPPPTPRRRPVAPRFEDDDEWVESSPRKRVRSGRPSSPPVIVRPALPHLSTPTPITTASVQPPPPTPSSVAAEDRRKPSQNSRLQILLLRHKELLKKDIIKKRGLLEKELGVEIQVRFQFITRLNRLYT